MGSKSRFYRDSRPHGEELKIQGKSPRISAMTQGQIRPMFFKTAAYFRRWLAKSHTSQAELWVGYHKKGSGQSRITYPESVDQAVCFGWIDGIRRNLNDVSYAIRFTPRKPRSIWSAVNIRNASALTAAGLMHPAGARAFAARTDDRSEIYSFERKRQAELDPAYSKKLAANKKAKTFFDAQRPSYRRTIVHWVMSAKQEITRLRRLGLLIKSCEEGKCGPAVPERPAAADGQRQTRSLTARPSSSHYSAIKCLLSIPEAIFS
jgi:uncharacterized protein YdeI (YjbR/CyaY-like superfamily)